MEYPEKECSKDKKENILDIKRKYPSLYNAAMILINNKGSFFIDDWYPNLLQRKDGTIVFSDPYRVT